MRVSWTYHDPLSSVVDSSGIPVGFFERYKSVITEKMFLQGQSKFSLIEQFISISIVETS